MEHAYEGEGFWGRCSACGGDGSWDVIATLDGKPVIIRCECGHEVVLQ
jgi:hypothetical protein